MNTLPTLAVTIGDPAGIGPEIVARLFSSFTPEHSRAIVIGAPGAYGEWIERSGFHAPLLGDPMQVRELRVHDSRVVMLDTGIKDDFVVGRESAGGGRHAGRAIEIACELAKNLSVSGIVTAPISKKSLNLGDFHYPGHTEMLARYLNSPQCQMMMVHGELRVVPLTRHLPLRDVAAAITRDAVVSCVRETAGGLTRMFGLAAPRIAVAGLNPHAGDSGIIGTEEIDVIAPAIDELRAGGIDVEGPYAADAMFQAAAAVAANKKSGAPRERRGYDAFVAMYHDQGLVPFKVLAQRGGVNVTIGLPVIRTSVDHGTAYDIAGRGVAETDSLLAAYKLAEQLSVITPRG